MTEPKKFEIQWRVYPLAGIPAAETTNIPSFLRYSIRQFSQQKKGALLNGEEMKYNPYAHPRHAPETVTVFAIVGPQQTFLPADDIYVAMHVVEAMILDDLKWMGMALFQGNGLHFYGDRDDFKATPAEVLRDRWLLKGERVPE